MSEHGVSATSPVTSGKRKLDSLKCFGCGMYGHIQNQCTNNGLCNVKCFQCGMYGHFRSQCSNNELSSPTQSYAVLPTVAPRTLQGGNTSKLGVPALPMPSSSHYRDNVNCFACGKRGHYQNRCPEKNESSTVHAHEALLNVATTNSEEGNMPKHGALVTLPTTSENHNLDNLICHECGKNELLQNQCSYTKVSTPTQDAVLPTVATTNLEGGNMSKHGVSATSPVTSGKRKLDSLKCFGCGMYGHIQNQCTNNGLCNVKCFKCGMYGHFRSQCSNNELSSPTQSYAVLPTVAPRTLQGGNTSKLGVPALSMPSSSHYRDNVNCFACGKRGHYQNRCPEKNGSSTVQAHEALLNVATTNSEEGNMPKHGALETLPTTSENHNLDNLICHECGKNENFQNQCSYTKVSVPTQDVVLPTVATTNLEGFEFMQQPSAGAFGSPSIHSSPFGSSEVNCFSATFGAPSHTTFGAGAASSPFVGQSYTPAFSATSSKPALFGSTSTSACDVQNTSSLCGSSSTPALGCGYYTSAFKNSTLLAPAFGTSGTSASTQQPTTTAVGLNSNQSSPLVSHHAISSNTSFGVSSQYAFGTPSTPVFGQSSTTVMGKAGSMPALFGSSATPISTSTSTFGSQSYMSYFFGTSSNSFGNQTTKPGNQATTPGNQTTTPGNQTTIPESQTTAENPMTTPKNQMTTSGNRGATPRNQITPENQKTMAESQMTAPECQTTTPESQTAISDQQKSIETPYASTQNTFGKSVSILDKSAFEDKHFEELRQEGYHGCDQEQVHAWGQTQSSPFGLTNIASSLDQSPKTKTPQSPVVVMSENNKGSGDPSYMATKTSVWWDIENCQVPRGCDAYYIAQNISSALADAGYKGAITISAYGDTHKIPKAVQQALSSTGIGLNHVPAGVKDASDKKILVDMLFWAVDNPPPANYLLISGDRDFSNALHQLRLRRYNILLAHAPPVSQALVAAAKKVWQWSSLLSGGPPLRDLEPGVKTSCVKKSSFSVIKAPIEKRLRWKDQNARETQKTVSVPESKEGCDIDSEKLVSFPRVPNPQASEITGTKRPSNFPSHEIVCAKRPRDFVDSHEQMFLESMLHLDNEKNRFNSQPFKLSQPFAPSDCAPSQNSDNNNNNNNSSITRPIHHHIMFGPPHLQFMHNKSTIIQHPTNYHQNIEPPQQCNNCQNNGYQVHSSEVHRHIGYIVSALTELKANKIAPTEENIFNCIHYGMGKRSIDVKMALNYACENNMLTRCNLDDGTPFYLGKNEQFWECVNVSDINDKHSEETWNAVRNFLTSASGRSAISSSECRYHAATIVKKGCLQHLPLGNVLQLLNTVIKFRKWIIPNPCGWQPLTFTIKVLSSGNA